MLDMYTQFRNLPSGTVVRFHPVGYGNVPDTGYAILDGYCPDGRYKATYQIQDNDDNFGTTFCLSVAEIEFVAMEASKRHFQLLNRIAQAKHSTDATVDIVFFGDLKVDREHLYNAWNKIYKSLLRYLLLWYRKWHKETFSETID